MSITPGYVIGKDVVLGAVGITGLRQQIEKVRESRTEGGLDLRLVAGAKIMLVDRADLFDRSYSTKTGPKSPRAWRPRCTL